MSNIIESTKVRISIDGVEIFCNEGDYILQVARRNGIEIPAICYLNNCSPTRACKMCMVEIDGKRAYACASKAKDGMQIITQSIELQDERRAIMQTYDVNHPLQCGVCDKSGECDLQNWTNKMGVQSQHFFIKESNKPHASWAKVNYDPNLCILCERCVTTCDENLGEANLKAQKADLQEVDTTLWKDTIPKDPLSVWVRRQKSLISFVGEQPCLDCAECVSVCPVGALIVKDFKYKANAWELSKIPTTCTHCAGGCLIYMESRHSNLEGKKQIYRITNDGEFEPICGTARFGGDNISEPLNATKIDLTQCVEAFSTAKSVIIGDLCTNEEIIILESLRQKIGFNLYNKRAQNFGAFITALKNAGVQIGFLSCVKQAKGIISIGTNLPHAMPSLRYLINQKLKADKECKFAHFHSFHNTLISRLGRNAKSFIYEVGEICAFLENLTKELMPKQGSLQEDSKDTSTQNQGEDSHTTQESTQDLPPPAFDGFFTQGFVAQNGVIIIGEEIYSHAQSAHIVQLLAQLAQSCKMAIFCIPPFGNALGMLSLAHLSDYAQLRDIEHCIGVRVCNDELYEEFGKMAFVLDSHNPNSKQTPPNVAIKALAQMEGSVLNAELRLLPLAPSFDCACLDLADIACGFGLGSGYMSDWSREMGAFNHNFTLQHLHSLSNFYAPNGENKRGKLLESNGFLDSLYPRIAGLKSFSNDTQPKSLNALLAHSPSYFNHINARSDSLQNKVGVYVSPAYAQSLNITPNDYVLLQNDKGASLKAQVFVDYNMDGEFFVLSPLLKGARALFGNALYTNLSVQTSSVGAQQ